MQNKQSEKVNKDTSQQTDKTNSLITGTIIAGFIIACPFLFYLYQGFPQSPTWDSPFGEYTSYSWGDVNFLAWVLFGKFVPFLLLLILTIYIIRMTTNVDTQYAILKGRKK